MHCYSIQFMLHQFQLIQKLVNCIDLQTILNFCIFNIQKQINTNNSMSQSSEQIYDQNQQQQILPLTHHDADVEADGDDFVGLLNTASQILQNYNSPQSQQSRRQKGQHCLIIKSVLSVTFLIILHFTTGIEANRFVTFWLICQFFKYCICLEGTICCEALVLPVWAIYQIYYAGQTLLEYKIYVLINIFEWFFIFIACCIIPLVCMCCCCFYTWTKCTEIAQKIHNYNRHQTYLRNIDSICANQLLSTDENIEINQCPICLNTEGTFCRVSCNHIFHPRCLRQWLRNHRSCPLCRRALY